MQAIYLEKMTLSGQQKKELQEALMDAFPTVTSLEQMLLYGLDKNLMAVAGRCSLKEIVFNLIQVAIAKGWLEDLIRAARNENPKNQQLIDIEQELCQILT